MSNGVLGIGRYQLENLIKQDVRFLFVDLRTEEERAGFQDPLLAKATPMTDETLQAALADGPTDAAIVLLSEDGRVASAVALRLEAEGFKNVYIIRDGVRALQG